MRDHLLGFRAIAALVADQHPRPAKHVTPPAPRFSTQEQEDRRKLDLCEVRPTVNGTPRPFDVPEGWNTCLPPRAGWYSVGNKNSKYTPDNIRAYFDGTRGTHWFGMLNPSVNGICTDEKIAKYAMAWQHEVHVEDENRL